MCTVSAVFPQVSPFVDKYWQPGPFNYDQDVKDLAKAIDEVLSRLDRIDKALGLKECKAEQKEKDEMIRKLREILK